MRKTRQMKIAAFLEEQDSAADYQQNFNRSLKIMYFRVVK
jgi:hypothetical protein